MPESHHSVGARSEKPSRKEAIALDDVPAQQEVILIRVEGGRGLLHRLAEMGIRPGVRFKVLSRGRPGPFIVTHGNTRLVLGRGMVARIFVRLPGR